ncbi:MAG: hypothetical protein Roseis3KO_06950 [Roseivirga sp.]
MAIDCSRLTLPQRPGSHGIGTDGVGVFYKPWTDSNGHRLMAIDYSRLTLRQRSGTRSFGADGVCVFYRLSAMDYSRLTLPQRLGPHKASVLTGMAFSMNHRLIAMDHGLISID